MNEQQRKRLVESRPVLTLEGAACSVAGWGNEYSAGISGNFAGFWETSWETVQDAIENNGGALSASDVRLVNLSWLGTGEKMPQALRRKAGLRDK